jgi:hypothetical protein
MRAELPLRGRGGVDAARLLERRIDRVDEDGADGVRVERRVGRVALDSRERVDALSRVDVALAGAAVRLDAQKRIFVDVRDEIVDAQVLVSSSRNPNRSFGRPYRPRTRRIFRSARAPVRWPRAARAGQFVLTGISPAPRLLTDCNRGAEATQAPPFPSTHLSGGDKSLYRSSISVW